MMLHIGTRLKTPIVRDTFIYTITDAVGKALGFILLPFVSYYLPPDGLGMATNFTVLTSVISLIAGQAIINSLPYFYYEQTKLENKTLVSNMFLFTTVVCVILLFFVFFLRDSICDYLKLNVLFQLCAVAYVVFNMIVNLNLQLYRLEDDAKGFAFYQILQIVLHTIVVVFFVIILKWEGPGKIWAEFSVMLILGIIHTTLLVRRGYFSLKYNSNVMRKLLKFGLPLMPHSISFWFKSGADKIFLTSFCGLYYNGIYSMAVSMCSLYTLVNNAFLKAYTPYLQKRLVGINEGNEFGEKRKIVKITYFLIGAFFVVSLLSVLFAWALIQYVLNVKYRSAYPLVPGIILSLYINAIYSFTIQFIYKQKKTFVLGTITFIGSLIQMLCSYIFIKYYGVMGTVYSAILGSAIISLAIFYYSNKVYELPWLYFLHKNGRNQEGY